MADIKQIIQFIKEKEGGYVNDPDDKGGCTNSGVTIAVFRKFFGKAKTCEDLKKLTDEEWEKIFVKDYWKPWKADEIQNQSIAQLVVDMGYMSGTKLAIKKVQACLGLKADGIVGPITLGALNDKSTMVTFRKLYSMRYTWLHQLALKANNKKYLRGWLNRLNSVKYSPF